MNMGRYVIAGFSLLFLLSEIFQLGLCERCIESEKQALLRFKASFLGGNLKGLSSWNPETSCCHWDGIVCHNVTGYVLNLDLSKYRLEASGVDPSLLELQHLIYLDLSGKNFNAASIPVFLGSMERLQYLSLSLSNFTGKIPTNFGGNLTDLKFLDLSSNDLHTNDMNWLSKLQSLQQLNLSGVYLGEAHNLFQVIHKLPSLSDLQLRSCGLVNLTVPLTPMNSTNNARIQFLNLAKNDIDGRILNALQNWTSVEILDLSYNNLYSLPMWFGGFKNLVSLDLSSNELARSIPIVLRNLSSLEDLDLSSNEFSSIPSWLRELRNLHHLDISFNQVIATMEISVSQILKNMCNLKILNLENSNLHGEAFGDSDLSGCIKYDIEKLFLSYNELNGHLPTWLGYLENLNYLDLSVNYFSGNIPQNLGQLVNLTTLDLSNNSFSGSIPQSLGQLVNLNDLSLSKNNLHGTIPRFLCQIKFLNYLDLSHNNFSGEIPNCWRDNFSFYGLMGINFSFNKLSGAFPISTSKLSSLSWLHLNNNHLEGKLPLTLKNSKQLTILDLGENKFIGSIPSWTNITFPTLQILRLRNNKLDGNIPPKLCQLRSLQILDLANNNLN